MASSVRKFLKNYNTVVAQTEFFVPRSSEYYLHFDINLSYPEEELKNCLANRETQQEIKLVNNVFDQRKDIQFSKNKQK